MPPRAEEPTAVQRLVIHALGPSANAFYAGKLHPHERRRLATLWHTQVALSARAARLQPVVHYPVEVEFVFSFRASRREYDCDNCHPTVKLVLDGLVAAGILTDDSRPYVGAVRMLFARERSERSDRVEVVIREMKEKEEP